MSENLISLAEYAKIHGIEGSVARRNAANGKYPTARKIGRNWVIDKDDPGHFTDRRVTTGKFIGRKKKKTIED